MKTPYIPRIALTIVFVAALLSALGGAVYYFFNLSFWPVLGVALAALAVAAVLSQKLFKNDGQNPISEPWARQPFAWVIPLVYAFAGVCFVILSRAGTDEAINTPWLKVPVLFWVAFAGAVAASIIVFIKTNKPLAHLLAALPLALVALSVAALVYKNGYGFDPFIHQSAEQFILTHGAISPKTPYYAGQYSLVVAIATFARLTVRQIDLWLVPVLASFGTVAVLAFSGEKMKKHTGFFLLASLSLFPFAAFINTTPFALACLYVFLAAALIPLGRENKTARLLVWVLAAAALITHPIAGVAGVTIAAVLSFKNKATIISLSILGAIGVPVLFLIQGVKFTFAPKNILSLPLPFEMPATRFAMLGDLIYAAGAASAALIIIFFLISLKNKQPGAWVNGLGALSAAAGALMTATIVDFTYLPNAEQAWYPARLLVVALLILVPAAAASFAIFLQKIMRRPLPSLLAIALLIFLICGNVYLSYPRSDAYVLGKGWSVGTADLTAVTAIAKDAGSNPYIVLAAEPVSAAAMSQLGFFKYFKTDKGEIFAYPIPLGGELYKYYLRMVYDSTSAATMQAAMKFAGVKRAYFVMNPYWTGFARISAAALASADAEIQSSGNDSIFLYTIK